MQRFSALRPVLRVSARLPCRLSARACSTSAAKTEEKPATPFRFPPTIEVIVSKIFPAGFGWQAASVVAGAQGFEADTMAFALTTGAGDFAGVLAGHSLFSIANAGLGRGGGLGSDLVAGLWLATAAFCSGTAWQPCVNYLHDVVGLNFVQTVAGCGATTGFAFFVGLRLGRVLYSPLGMPGGGLYNDAMLSLSIGAATGTFVGTDLSFTDNFLSPAFGVTDTMSDLEGCIRAGSSTATGFLCMQTTQNLLLPGGWNWLDK